MYLVVCVLEMCHSWLHIMQVLTGYISAPLSAIEMELVTNVRSRFKGICPNGRKCLRLTCVLTLTNREEDLQGGGPVEVSTEARACKLVMGPHPCGSKAGDKSGKYCIGNLAMDLFTELLHRRQQNYPNICWMSVLLKHHTSVTLHNKGRISGIIWGSFKATPQPDVFMPLLETSDGHWLLLVTDLRECSFLVYDSLPNPMTKSRRELVDSAVNRLCVLWLVLQICVSFEPTPVGPCALPHLRC
ncbi:LOW QUALITY PROTEIN: hypothetical protein Cgig2_002662 [Carnegiea gigantea]|uniref:Ubiquitin-like protease family profile domain-containing protein n=1 Tax=Carnegiea gigantea TaxID=171969 RepID=A0A9Q1QCD8_9CARY|nr:LOW QUALITY PROTEIN: hypothetical protein Cgig2_002662 [Carnegiea gigantea]